jgi:hypothetical protein
MISIFIYIVTTEKPIQALVVQVKKSDRESFKKKVSWGLRQLKLLDAKYQNKVCLIWQKKKMFVFHYSHLKETDSELICITAYCIINQARHCLDDCGALQFCSPPSNIHCINKSS